METLQDGTVKVQLPSRGRLYGGAWAGGNVTLRPWTTDEEMLLNSTRDDRNEVINSIIAACVVNKEVSLDDVLVGDKMYLLLALRAVTYGEAVGGQYNLLMSCRGCQRQTPVTLKLPDGFTIRILNETDSEPFEVELPVSKKKVSLRLLRVKDERVVTDYAARHAVDKGDPGYKYTLARHIMAIDGLAADDLTALALINTPLVGRDSLALRQAIAAHDCGPDITLSVRCAWCGNMWKELMPLTEEFFSPSPVALRGDG